ncbi:MAG: cysteine hydrolase [Clostridiales bacterium]|jgi:nicotinamidase-related amidase|nr:cysteine hydrolase [Clostridiales bacterium]
MRKALIIVDYQYDFVAEDGALKVEGARAIEGNIAALADEYDEADIYFTLDSHADADWGKPDVFPETRAFGKHCLRGTKGWEIYGQIKGKANEANYISKCAYCPGNDYLQKLVVRYDEFTVVGVVTDICVFQTVIGLYSTAVNNGVPITITVRRDACASFNPARQQFALDYMRDILHVNLC